MSKMLNITSQNFYQTDAGQQFFSTSQVEDCALAFFLVCYARQKGFKLQCISKHIMSYSTNYLH